MAPEDPQYARNKPPDLIGDCRLMLRHALKEGLDIPTDLQRDLTALDRELIRCKISTVSNVSACLLDPDSATTVEAVSATDDSGESGAKQRTTAQPSGEAMQLLYKVHGALLRVVALATVGSLLATEPMPGTDKMIFRGMPKIVRWAAIAAIVCAIGFILTAIPVAQKKSDGKPTTKVETGGAETNRSEIKSAPQSGSSLNKGADTGKQP